MWDKTKQSQPFFFKGSNPVFRGTRGQAREQARGQTQKRGTGAQAARHASREGRAQEGQAPEGQAREGRAQEGRVQEGRVQEGRAQEGRAQERRRQERRALTVARDSRSVFALA